MSVAVVDGGWQRRRRSGAAASWRRGRAGGGSAILTVLALVALLRAAARAARPERDRRRRGSSRRPSLAHPFGSDALGRDVLSRVIFAYRVSLGVAVGSTLLAFLVGIPLGLYAGYHGGWVDTAIMRPIDMVLALPAMLLAVALIAIIGPGSNIALARDRGDLHADPRARGAELDAGRGRRRRTSRRRGPAGPARGRSSRATSCPTRSVPAIVQATILMGFAIQIEAALSFLGLGAQPPTSSLGVMLADGRDVLTQAPWVEVFPGLAIAITVLAFNFLGDGLRARLDPTGVTE